MHTVAAHSPPDYPRVSRRLLLHIIATFILTLFFVLLSICPTIIGSEPQHRSVPNIVLILADEKEHPLAAPPDPFAGRPVLWEEPLAENRWDAAWKVTQSQQPGTSVDVADGAMRISAAANAAVYLERSIPAGVRLAACTMNQSSDGGASWGPGMTLVWPDGKVLRVNLRAEGRFGVDDGRRQVLEGVNLPDTWTQVTIQLDEQEVLVRAYQELQGWQDLARIPRTEFAGDPVAVRVGKMSPGSRNEDFSELGPSGQCAIKEVRLFGG